MPFRKVFRKKSDVVMEVPILCKFWQEDGVWNATAVDLPIAVFGNTFEDARRHMSDALIAHLNALKKLGELEAMAEYLRTVARERPVNLEEMALNQPFVRISAAVQDEHVMAVV